jgi:hypothetical protein
VRIQLVLGAGCIVLTRIPRQHGDRSAPATAGLRIGPEDYVTDEALPRILKLIEESSRREDEKAAKWKREAEIEESSHRENEKAAKWKREAELQELLLDAVSSDDDI